MNLHDILFLDIARSVRVDWGPGIEARGRAMQALVPNLTVYAPDKHERITERLEKMIDEAADGDFDGRDYGSLYETPMEADGFDSITYELFSIYDEDRMYVAFPYFFIHPRRGYGGSGWKDDPEGLRQMLSEMQAKTNEAIDSFLRGDLVTS